MRRSKKTSGVAVDPKAKRRLLPHERRRRRDESRRAREAERRSLTLIHGMPMEPRIDPRTVAARRAEIPSEDARDLTARLLGDPNPADVRRRAFARRQPQMTPERRRTDGDFR